MADRIQQRPDTASRWSQYNPILLEGEVGYELDTDQYKVGDGEHAWNELPYRGDPCLQQTGQSTTTPMSQKAVTDELELVETNIDIYSDILQNTTNIFVFEKKYVSLNGEEKGTSLNLNCTDYLPISAFKDVLVYAYNYSSGEARLVTFFDSNKTFLGASNNGDNTYKEISIEELAEGFWRS